VQACPVSAIRLVWSGDPLLNGKPAIEPEIQACVLCPDLSCMKACPTGALQPVARQEIRMGTAAVLPERCVRTTGEDCRICVEKCPVGPAAIDIPYEGAEVSVMPDACTGCGVCEMACPVQPRAIVVEKAG
jgi:ferredoxin-type protein NapG